MPEEIFPKEIDKLPESENFNNSSAIAADAEARQIEVEASSESTSEEVKNVRIRVDVFHIDLLEITAEELEVNLTRRDFEAINNINSIDSANTFTANYGGNRLGKFVKALVDHFSSLTTKQKALTRENKTVIDEARKSISDLGDIKTDQVAKTAVDITISAVEKLETNKIASQEIDVSGKNPNLKKFLWAIAVLSGIAGGIGLTLYLLSQALTGCYQYKGTTNSKILCPDSGNPGACGCFNSRDHTDTSQSRTEYCKAVTLANYPFCCNKSYALCTGTPGQDDFIYYAYKKITCLDVLCIPLVALNDLINLGKGGFGSIFKYLLIGGAIILAILFIYFIIRIILK